jgi:glycosyltransferase involved in cell wall biosynthesis
MKIAVNTRLLLEGKLEGIGWFTLETMKRITSAHKEHEFLFFFDRPFSNKYIFSDNIRPLVLHPQARHPFLYYLYFEHAVSGALKKYKADYFISTDGFISLNTDVKTLDVIHDINFEHRPQDLPFMARKYYQRYFPKFAQKASRIATVSEYSRQDIIETYKIDPAKIDVVYNGCNEIYGPVDVATQTRIRNKYAGGHQYFLYVGSMHARKNIVHLLKAFEAFKTSSYSDMKLLLVGQYMWGDDEISQTLQQISAKNDVYFLGRIISTELKEIIASAFALTYVPYYEGFGIPILEGFYSDIPVITSNVTSMPEVAGEAALYADPHSIDSISDAMVGLFKDPHLRKKLIETGRIQREKFTWNKTADKLWQSFEKMAER